MTTSHSVRVVGPGRAGASLGLALERVGWTVLEPIRRRMPGGGFGIDFSPLIVIFAIYFLQIFLIGSLRDIAFRLR